MGEISDALARAKRVEKKSSGRPSVRPTASVPRDADLENELRDEIADRRLEGRRSGETSSHSSPMSKTQPRESPSGLDARTRAEILSPKPSESSPVASSRCMPASSPTSSPERVQSAAPSIPIIHRVPREKDAYWIQRLCVVDPDSQVAVRFRHFGARVRSILDQSTRHSVLVTSAFAGEGKTTVSTNLALAIASIAPENRVALVDLDLRRGTIEHVMGYECQQGIELALRGEISLDEVRVETDLNRLDFYPTGRSVSQAHQVLGGGVARILEKLHERYDYVICDGPPVLPVPDVPLIAPHVGGCLAVVGSGKTRHRFFSQMVGLIPRNALFGVFLNECPSANFDGDYRYYGAEQDEGDTE